MEEKGPARPPSRTRHSPDGAEVGHGLVFTVRVWATALHFSELVSLFTRQTESLSHLIEKEMSMKSTTTKGQNSHLPFVVMKTTKAKCYTLFSNTVQHCNYNISFEMKKMLDSQSYS